MSQEEDKSVDSSTNKPVEELEEGDLGMPRVQRVLDCALRTHFAGKLVPSRPHAWKGYGLTFVVENKESLYDICQELRDSEHFLFNMLIDVTCVDWLDSRESRFEVVYQLLSLAHGHRLCLKVAVPEQAPELSSVRPLWPAANFLEREVWDMFGVKFSGHGDLRRILLYEEFVGHPLRKDYPLRAKQPRVKMRLPEGRNTSADMQKEELVALPVRTRLGQAIAKAEQKMGRD